MYDKCNKMLRAGADGFVTKSAPPSQLIATILRCARKPD
jgi:DNA-binding NarL/FixJ family response regulator